MQLANITPPRPARPVVNAARAIGTRARSTFSDEVDVSAVSSSSGSRTRNVLVAMGALAVIGAFVAAPYRAADQLRAAVESGDTKRLEEAIDFAAVREDLKRQASAATAPQTDPLIAGLDVDDARRAQLGAGVAGAMLANAMIDAVVRPEMVARLKDAPVDEDTKARVTAAVKSARLGYDGPLSFSLRVPVPELSPQPIRVVWRHSGVFTWQVKAIALPTDLSRLQELAAQREASFRAR